MAEKLPSTPSNTHDVSGEGDRYEALVELLEHQASQSARDRELELEQLRRSRERRGPRPYWLLGVTAILAAWVWLLPPAFLRTDPPPPQPVEREEAALRFAMYVQAQRIAGYRMQTGEYPDRLEEAGPPLPAMEYTRLSDGLYQLTGQTDRMRLTYRSDLPLRGFVGSGADILGGGDAAGAGGSGSMADDGAGTATQPVDSVGQVESVGPVDSAAPADSVRSLDSAGSVDSAGAADPTDAATDGPAIGGGSRPRTGGGGT